MNEELLKKIVVYKEKSIKDTMRKIDENGLGIAFIIDDKEKLIGVVTDGDIRRAILKGIPIRNSIKKIMNRNPIKTGHELTEEKKRKLLKNSKIRKKIPPGGTMKIPIVDENGKIVGIDFLYGEKRRKITVTTSREKAVKNVLIVGGAGYLGSVLCRKLLDRGYRVRVLDNLLYGDEGIKELYENKNFGFIEGDMRDIQVVMDAIKNMDAVIHLAAIVGDPASALDPEETIEINYLGTKMLAEVCKYNQINRFIFASTCSVYGVSPTPETRISEESMLNPVSLYAEMKLRSERGILELMDENFSPTILRMATLYGLSPRMRFDLVINLLTAKAVADKKITIFGGEQWRPFLHVKDAAEAYLKCIEAPIAKIRGEIFNVGSNDQNHQIKDIGNIIHEVIPQAEIIIDKENVDRRDYNVAFDKINKTLGYQTMYKIREGVTEIKYAIEKGVIQDYTHPKYSNFKFLQDKNNC